MPDTADIRTDATREIAERVNNLNLPIYTTDEDRYPKFDALEDDKTALDAAFGQASGIYDEDSHDEAVLAVFEQFARLLPKLDIVQTFHDPSTAEWHWARLRCILAGAGFNHHAPLATILSALYPMCPLHGDETREVWKQNLIDAHRMSGWPVTIGCATWLSLTRSISRCSVDTLQLRGWHKVVALLHVIKHMRFSFTSGFVITYQAKSVSLIASVESNALSGAGSKHGMFFNRELGAPVRRGKSTHPLTEALNSVYASLSTSDLLLRKPLSHLPGFVLAGPWSRAYPDPTTMGGFIQHGQRLNDVWVASDGRVQPVSGETADIVGYDWTVTPLTPDEISRNSFLAGMPDTYDVNAAPSDVFLGCFPNVSVQRYGLDLGIYCAVLDATLAACMLVREVKELTVEKPLMLFLPAEAAPDEATNQGKTWACKLVANAVAPGIALLTVSNTTDMPGQRAIHSEIRRHGTLCLDEWHLVPGSEHPLAAGNLQSLLVGNEVSAGMVRENGSHPIRLVYPLFANSKTFAAPPDMVNRCIPTFLERFDNTQRLRGGVVAELESGRAALRMRLAALGVVEKYDLLNWLPTAPAVTSNEGMRYPRIRAMAARILSFRTAQDFDVCCTAVDTYMAAARAALGNQLREAESSGLLSQMEDGETVVIRAYSLFAEVGVAATEQIKLAAERYAPDNGSHGFSPTALLKARLDVAGMNGRPLSALLSYVGNGARVGRVSDRTMALALSRDLKALLPDVGSVWLLPDIAGERGWKLTRRPDNSGAVRVALTQEAPATHMTRG
jgi:hypothetical protein